MTPARRHRRRSGGPPGAAASAGVAAAPAVAPGEVGTEGTAVLGTAVPGSSSGEPGRARHVLTAGLLAASGLAFAGNAVFARLLGKSGYGAVGSVLALASLLAIPLSAVQAAVTRQSAVALAGAFRLRRPVALTALGAALLVAAAALLAPFLDALLHLQGEGIVVLLGAYLGAILLEGVPRGALVGERRYALVAAVVAGGALTRLLVGWVWVALRPDAVGPVAGAAVGEIVTAIALLVVLAGPARRRGTRDRSLRIHDVGLSIVGFTGLLSLMSIDTVAARHWLSPQGSGYYAAASAGGSIAYFAAAAAATAIFPDVAKGVSSDDARSFRVGLAEVAAIAAATAGLLALAAPIVVSVVFGSRYDAARAPMRILALSYALLGVLAYLVSHHLAHRSRAVLVPWLGAVVLVAAVALAHGSATSVAYDALGASASLLVAMGSASYLLERRAAGRGRRVSRQRVGRRAITVTSGGRTTGSSPGSTSVNDAR